MAPLAVVGVLSSAQPDARREVGGETIAENLIAVHEALFEVVVDKRLLHMGIYVG